MSEQAFPRRLGSMYSFAFIKGLKAHGIIASEYRKLREKIQLVLRLVEDVRTYYARIQVAVKLTNDRYTILIGTKNFTERYFRDKKGWLKISAQGKTFYMTAEQVLNHLLPALTGIKSNLTIKVEYNKED